MNFSVPHFGKEKNISKFLGKINPDTLGVLCWLVEFGQAYLTVVRSMILEPELERTCSYFNFVVDNVLYGNHTMKTIKNLGAGSEHFVQSIKAVKKLIKKNKWEDLTLYKKIVEASNFKISEINVLIENNITGYDLSQEKIYILENLNDPIRRFLVGIVVWTFFE